MHLLCHGHHAAGRSELAAIGVMAAELIDSAPNDGAGMLWTWCPVVQRRRAVLTWLASGQLGRIEVAQTRLQKQELQKLEPWCRAAYIARPVAVEVVMDVRAIDELARKLAGALPAGMQSLKEDAERNFRGVLQAALSRMQLVSREEFDVQAGVLARTREKLQVLEQRLAQLENRAR